MRDRRISDPLREIISWLDYLHLHCDFFFYYIKGIKSRKNTLKILKMIRRNLIVVYRPVKSNSVILSEPNHRLMNLTVSRRECKH